jgi:hypothetical protein
MRLLVQDVLNVPDFLSHLQVLINQQEHLTNFVNIIKIQSVIVVLLYYVTIFYFIDTNFEIVRYFISKYRDCEAIMSVCIQLRKKVRLTTA